MFGLVLLPPGLSVCLLQLRALNIHFKKIWRIWNISSAKCVEDKPFWNEIASMAMIVALDLQTDRLTNYDWTDKWKLNESTALLGAVYTIVLKIWGIKGIFSVHCWFTAGIPEMFAEYWVDISSPRSLQNSLNLAKYSLDDWDIQRIIQKEHLWFGHFYSIRHWCSAENSLLFSSQLIFNDLLLRSSSFSHSMWLKSNFHRNRMQNQVEKYQSA